MGQIPNHIPFIMDGNRRFAKKLKLKERDEHKAGFRALMQMLKYCPELGVKYITVHAFSIDNFNRSPEEVQSVMGFMEIFHKRESILENYGIRVLFIGDLKLLNESNRVTADKVMKATAGNTNTMLLVCVAYTPTNEISHAVDESCKEKLGQIVGSGNDIGCSRYLKVVDIEKCIYIRVAPDPDIMFRTSGETRLSNFLLWQTSNCLLYSPNAFWRELSLRHFLWGVLQFQASYSYLEKKKKQS